MSQIRLSKKKKKDHSKQKKRVL